MPYIAVELDALNAAPDVARSAGITDDAAVAGLVRLWARCFRLETDQITTGQISGVFGGEGGRVAAALAEFGFLEPRDGAWRVKGADRYIRLKEARRQGGHAAKKHLIPGAAHRSDPSAKASAAADGPAEAQPKGVMGWPSALSPTTDDRQPKEEKNGGVRTSTYTPTNQLNAVAISAATERALIRPPLFERMNAVFARVLGAPFAAQWPRKAQDAMRDLLGMGSEDEICRRLEKGLRLPQSEFGSVRSPQDLVTHWGRLAGQPDGLNRASGANPLKIIRPGGAS